MLWELNVVIQEEPGLRAQNTFFLHLSTVPLLIKRTGVIGSMKKLNTYKILRHSSFFRMSMDRNNISFEEFSAAVNTIYSITTLGLDDR